MKPEGLDVLDPPQSRLRTLVASVDKYVADLSNQDVAGTTALSLRGAWLELSKALALGEEPTLRDCPNCSRRIPREATRCRYCMAHSEAQIPPSAAEPAR